MTVPRLDNLKKLLPAVMPYVDRCVIVIGEKQQESIDYIKSFGEKVLCVYRKWDDSFANQYNTYLQYVNSGWVLICDDDELPSEGLLKSLDNFVNDSNRGNKFSVVEFRSNAISHGTDTGPDEYWRHIFFRYKRGMQYRGGPKTGCHQYLVGYQNNLVQRSNELYYHIKSLPDEHRNAARNYFIYGIWLHGSSDGDQREEWHELKQVLAKEYPEVKVFPDLDSVLQKGQIKPGLRNWMVRRYKEYDGHPEYNEMRAVITYYFKFLHPEELQEGELNL